MRSSHLEGLRLVASATAALAIISFLALLAHSDTTYAATFNPTSTACLDNETTEDPDPLIPFPPPAEECDGDSSAGAVSGITTSLSIPEGDSNFGGIISFTPPEWTVARDADVPDGALVAKLTSRARLGFLNNPCNSSLVVQFEMMDATTDPSTTVVFADQFADDDGDGLPNAVTSYPDFLLRIRPEPSVAKPLPLPIARLYGQAVVGGINVSLNFLIFEPGVTLANTALAPTLGYPSVTVLQAIGDPDIVPNPDNANAITDFCSPLSTVTTTFGTTKDNPNTAANEGGVTYRSNPTSDGTFNFVIWARSQRDADNDGFENSLDPCPFDPNPNWDPRAASALQPGADSDRDGIPDECDPTPDEDTNLGDHDGDVYFNRVDNCPTVANGTAEDNLKDSDFDGIGDACDTVGAGGIGKGPNDPDGDLTILCIVSQVAIGAGGTAPEVKGQPCTEDVIGATLAPGLSVLNSSLSAAPGSSVTLTATLADDSGNPRAGEEITFNIQSQPGTGADLVFAGVPRWGDAQGELANLQGAAQVTKITDDTGTATATLSTGTQTGQIVVSVEGGGETETITVTVAEGAPAGPAETGVGALAPAASSVPLWAAIASGLGLTGILGAIGAYFSRVFRRGRRG